MVEVDGSLAVDEPLAGGRSRCEIHNPLRNQTVDVDVSNKHAVEDILAAFVFCWLAAESHDMTSSAHTILHHRETFVIDTLVK